MFYLKKKKFGPVIISFLLLIAVLLFLQWQEEREIADSIEQKIEAMGTDEFQLCLWNPSVRTDNGQDVEIDWWFHEDAQTYYLFLPSGDNGKFRYIFNCFDTLQIDEQLIKAGDFFQLENGRHELSGSSGESFSLKVMQSGNIAAMHIRTDLDDLAFLHESKQNFDTGSYILMDENGGMESYGYLDSIRGRGNMTFDAADKKSYNIRMREKTAVLDLGIGKNWALLANPFDESLSRNQMVTEMGNAMNMAYVPDMDYVDLYINGEYQGNYQLSEKVEIGQERLNIRDLEKEMKVLNPDLDFDLLAFTEGPVDEFTSLKWVDGLQVPQNSESGYLLELDMTYRYYEEQSGFITSHLQPVVIKSPQCASYEQVYYIANKYQDMENALCAADGCNEMTGLYYYDYLDLYSFAQKYLVDEFSKNLDAALTSFYMYIPETEDKFYAGPIWDYDRTFGVDFERSGVDLKDPETFYVSENIYFEESDINVFHLLCQQEEFSEIYKNLYWNEVRDIVVEIAEHSVDENADRIEKSAMMDAVRNESFGEGLSVDECRELFYEINADIKAFMQKRIEFFDREWK